jgi:hypothetical protein
MSTITEISHGNLDEFGIKGFGFTMPGSTQKWCSNSNAALDGVISFAVAELALNIISDDSWLAPFSATSVYVNTTDNFITTTLIRGDGHAINEEGWFCTLYPQQYLRLQRLIAKNFETDNVHNPLKSQGLSVRPVPRYFFIAKAGETPIVKKGMIGMINAGDDFGCGGKLQFFDENGNIIHPLYVANIIKGLLGKYTVLNLDDTLPDQLSGIINLATETDISVRLINPDGTPNDGTNLEGFSPNEATIGLFTVNGAQGADTTVSGEIKRKADTGTTGDFPAAEAGKLLICRSTYGRFGKLVSLNKTNTILLQHDFFTVKVIKVGSYLLGSPNAKFNGTKLEPTPPIRLNEQLSLLTNGNDLMAAINTVLTGAADSFAVATQINAHFLLPANASKAHWPDFPPLPAGFTADDAVFLPTLKDELKGVSKAEFITGTTTQPCDVKLTLSGLPKGAAIRVYNRVFDSEATLSRGDGGGAIVINEIAADPVKPRAFNGQCVLALINPLGILQLDGTTVVPQSPLLIFDLVILQRSGKKTVLGAVEIPVQPAVAPPQLPDNNLVENALHKGVSNAAILGYDTHNLKSILSLLHDNDKAEAALQLLGENPNLRDAPRLPTMARRDLLVAGKQGALWQSVIAGGPFTPAICSDDPKDGCPGSLVGRETIYTGVVTKNARLAYDISRMAFRRTTYFAERLVALADSSWDEPAANVELNETEATTEFRGTFSGAILQNIAPYCETPELCLLKSLMENEIDSIPKDFNSLVDKVVTWINGIGAGLTGLLGTAAGKLKTEVVDKLNGLKDNNPASESRNERLYNELKREISSSCYGRRDSQWAIDAAIKRARNFIYIETPGASFTKANYPNDPNAPPHDYAIDLFETLATQLTNNPGLRVIICLPKKPDYHASYTQWIQSEIKKRYELLNMVDPMQIVWFHPIGFPGRPANIESQIVIVDDTWALVGSSAFRRRGLTFDGSADIVFTDGEIVNGKSSAIKNFRTSLLQKRLAMENLTSFDPQLNILQDGKQSFYLIRQLLIAGGIGKIERLWNGHTDGIEFQEPTIGENLANPDGLESNSIENITLSVFADIAK